MFLPPRHSNELFHDSVTYKIQYNTWNPGCMHYVLLCQANLGQAFRLSRTTFVKKACIKFEYVSKPVYSQDIHVEFIQLYEQNSLEIFHYLPKL